MKNIVIVDAARTPMGAFNGQFKNLSAVDLGAAVIKQLTRNIDIHIDEIFMGCVLQAGLGQSVARQAAIKAGISNTIPCTTFNKVCGSAMQSMISGIDAIKAGRLKTVIAGGMESMTNAPYLLDKARTGYRAGHGQLLDSLYKDGLEDALTKSPTKQPYLMGVFAEKLAEKYQFTREEQENFSKTTYENYQNNKEYIHNEIIAIDDYDRKGNVTTLDTDEPPQKVNPEKFANLKPAFGKEGTITAATSSSLADGAAGLLLMDEDLANKKKLTPLATIIGVQTHAGDPQWFSEAPVYAIEKLLKQVNWTIDAVDLFEVNEAFAVVPMAVMKHFNINHSKMNVFGGACTLGHPLGASGARIIVTLMNALRVKKLKRGIASACIGGGEAIAIAIELN